MTPNHLVPLEYYLVVAAVLFIIGVGGLPPAEEPAGPAHEHRAHAQRGQPDPGRVQPAPAAEPRGQVFAFFVIAVAAAEAAVGLAIVLSFFRVRQTVRSDEADLLRN